MVITFVSSRRSLEVNASDNSASTFKSGPFFQVWCTVICISQSYLKPSNIFMSKTGKQQRSSCYHIVPPHVLYKFWIAPSFIRLTGALWVSVYQSGCSTIYIHIENLLPWLFYFSNHPEIKDNSSVLSGRRWTNSQLAGHQLGRLPYSMLQGGKWWFGA